MSTIADIKAAVVAEYASVIATERYTHSSAYLQAIADELAVLIDNGWCGKDDMARLMRLARRGLLLDIDQPCAKASGGI